MDLIDTADIAADLKLSRDYVTRRVGSRNSIALVDLKRSSEINDLRLPAAKKAGRLSTPKLGKANHYNRGYSLSDIKRAKALRGA